MFLWSGKMSFVSTAYANHKICAQIRGFADPVAKVSLRDQIAKASSLKELGKIYGRLSVIHRYYEGVVSRSNRVIWRRSKFFAGGEIIEDCINWIKERAKILIRDRISSYKTQFSSEFEIPYPDKLFEGIIKREVKDIFLNGLETVVLQAKLDVESLLTKPDNLDREIRSLLVFLLGDVLESRIWELINTDYVRGIHKDRWKRPECLINRLSELPPESRIILCFKFIEFFYRIEEDRRIVPTHNVQGHLEKLLASKNLFDILKALNPRQMRVATYFLMRKVYGAVFRDWTDMTYVYHLINRAENPERLVEEYEACKDKSLLLEGRKDDSICYYSNDWIIRMINEGKVTCLQDIIDDSERFLV